MHLKRMEQVVVLLGASAVSIALYLIGAAANDGFQFYFLVWNLFLAWLPLVFVWLLFVVLRRERWSSWPALALTFLWLIFLPNSFYLLSDFVHLFDIPEANITYNIVMLASFAFNGLLLGFISLFLMHKQLIRRRHGMSLSWGCVVAVLALSSWAIYLGRYMRLNSWDFIINFAALLFSVSDIVLHPNGYPAVIGVTASFFVLLMMIYIVLWRLSAGTDILKPDETRINR